MSKNDRWTNQDEADLQRRIARKEELTARNMAPLIALCCKYLGDEDDGIDFAEALVSYADEFRDALEPFDSGVRVVEA
jgi:hypothetical protein